MSDARRDQVEHEFMIDSVAANDDGVAGVVAALISSDNVEMRREQINNLALPSSPHCAPMIARFMYVVFVVRRLQRNQ